MSQGEFNRLILGLIRTNGISKTDLARRAGISRQTLYKLLNGDVQEAKVSTFIKLAAVLEASPLSLMQAVFAGTGIAHEGTRPPRRGHGRLAQQPGKGKYPGDASSFITDLLIPDNAAVMVDSRFEKGWKILNAGNVAWVERRLRCVDSVLRWESLTATDGSSDDALSLGFATPRPIGLKPEAWEVPIPRTQPGEEAVLTVALVAPDVQGTYVSYWKMVDKQGDLCFPKYQGLSCIVKVVSL